MADGQGGFDGGQFGRPADEVRGRGGRLLDRRPSRRLPLLPPQDREVGLAQPLAGVDAELVGQRGPDALVRGQRLRLPAARGQGEDQLGVQRLVELVPPRQPAHRLQSPFRYAEVARQGGEPAHGGGVLGRHRGLQRAGGELRHVELAPPQRDGLAEPGQRLLGPVIGRPRDQVAKAQQVELVGGDREPVAATPAGQHTPWRAGDCCGPAPAPALRAALRSAAGPSGGAAARATSDSFAGSFAGDGSGAGLGVGADAHAGAGACGFLQEAS
ncbi:hypothetical protein GCM10020001_106410 [Nonomuraea salmonea]